MRFVAQMMGTPILCFVIVYCVDIPLRCKLLCFLAACTTAGLAKLGDERAKRAKKTAAASKLAAIANRISGKAEDPKAPRPTMRMMLQENGRHDQYEPQSSVVWSGEGKLQLGGESRGNHANR